MGRPTTVMAARRPRLPATQARRSSPSASSVWVASITPSWRAGHTIRTPSTSSSPPTHLPPATGPSPFSGSGAAASKGTVSQAGNVLTWSITELRTETVTLRYTATHDATASGGVEQGNKSAAYSDAEGHTVTFPNPSVNVHGCAAAIELTPPT